MSKIAEDITKQARKKASGISDEGDHKKRVLTIRSDTIRTLDGALKATDVDTAIWDVDRWSVNKRDFVSKTDLPAGVLLAATELWQVRVWLKRKPQEQIAVESLVDSLKKYSPICPKLTIPRRRKGTPRRAFEFDLMDPHLGLHCFKPASDQAWSIEECEQMSMYCTREILHRAESYMPFEQIVWPFGNDFMHVDTLWHQTTGGTPQPEADAFHHTYERGVKLAIAIIEELKRVAPVKIIQIPGNHDRQTAFTMGLVLWAYYHNDKNVTVDCSSAPYKFFRYGQNLIGFEHGHSVPPIRLAALMANECRKDWAETCYREWHCGDQHRKGVGKPLMFEEQGVSIEYLPGLTPPNEWHKLKGFNWQKRGITAYIWDYDFGPQARLQVSFDAYTGKPIGVK